MLVKFINRIALYLIMCNFGLLCSTGICSTSYNSITDINTNNNNVNTNNSISTNLNEANSYEANIIRKINEIDTSRVVNNYSFMLHVFFGECINCSKIYSDNDKVKLKLQFIEHKYNELVSDYHYADDELINLINEVFSKIQLPDDYLKNITESFRNNTWSNNDSLLQTINPIVKKFEKENITDQEVDSEYKKFEDKYYEVIENKINLLDELYDDIFKYINDNLSNYSDNIQKCLKGKISNIIYSIIGYYKGILKGYYYNY